MKKIIVISSLCVGLITLNSCIQKQFKNPVGGRTPQSSEELITGADRILTQLRSETIFNAKTCGSYLAENALYIFSRPYDYYAPKTEVERSSLKAKSQDLVQKIFQIRITLKDKLKDFYESNSVTPECADMVRRSMRIARTAEEMVLLWMQKSKALPAYPNRILAGGYPQTVINPKYASDVDTQGNLKIESGDVLMMRGTSVVSSTIARIGDEDGNFSHVALAYRDVKGKLYLIEALIETGTIITSYDEFLTKTEGRVAVYRYPDRKLAHEAAAFMYRYAKDYQWENRKKELPNIPYDFAMDLASSEAMFCSEVVRFAYLNASNGTVVLPTFKTLFGKTRGTQFMKSMGIKVADTFSPNDMDIEPSFDLVAEYRNLAILKDIRRQDVSMQTMFYAMEQLGYDITPTSVQKGKAALVRFGGNLGIQAIRKRLPDGMSQEAFYLILALRDLHDKSFVPALKAYEDNFEKVSGLLPSFQDLLDYLSVYRKSDCQKHRDGKSSDFHDFFNTSKQCQ